MLLIISGLLFWHTSCIYIYEGGYQIENEKKQKVMQPLNKSIRLIYKQEKK